MSTIKDMVKEHSGTLTGQYMMETGPRDRGMVMVYTYMLMAISTQGCGKKIGDMGKGNTSTRTTGLNTKVSPLLVKFGANLMNALIQRIPNAL